MKFPKTYKVVILILCLLMVSAVFAFFRIGYWLSENDELQASDAILVLSGSLAERPLLYEDGVIVAQIFPKEYEALPLKTLALGDQRTYGSTTLCFYELCDA